MIEIIQGDCLEVMAGMPEASVDAIVCDPPYDLLQASRKGSVRTNVGKPGNPYAGGAARAGGFMGQAWDATGVAFEVATWELAYRVLKPGGHLVAFGGTRTFHRLTCAIEDAGFEIRDDLAEFWDSSDAARAFIESLSEDQLRLLLRAVPADSVLGWSYGSGFPKSLDVSKAIDKASGVEREVVSRARNWGASTAADGKTGYGDYAGEWSVTAPATDAAREWDGWGTALKPAWEPIILARKPLSEPNVAANVLKHHTGAINIDGCRIGGHSYTQEQWRQKGASRTTGTTYGAHKGSETQLPDGRWPANVVLSHTADCREIGTREVKGYTINRFSDGAKPFGNGAGHPYTSESKESERVTVWDCSPDCPVRLLDDQSGQSSEQARVLQRNGDRLMDGWGLDGKSVGVVYGDSGGASRFFYTAKASTSERNERVKQIGERNGHPTVKPVDLMRWLCRLVTPPGGHILDPFAGSGSTLVAALLEGFSATGIEQSSEYVKIARARVDGVQIGGLF